jgi:hypothetical protein
MALALRLKEVGLVAICSVFERAVIDLLPDVL